MTACYDSSAQQAIAESQGHFLKTSYSYVTSMRPNTEADPKKRAKMWGC